MVEWFVKWCELEQSDGRMGELGSEWSDGRRREWKQRETEEETTTEERIETETDFGVGK